MMPHSRWSNSLVRRFGQVGLITLLSVAALSPATAYARKNGIAVDGCTGCHGSDKPVTVSATMTPARFQPGEQIIVDVSVGASEVTVAGLYVEVEDNLGTLGTLAGEGLALVGGGLTHAAPKAASNGVSHFRFSWRAPSTVGAARFNLYAVAANGDGKRSGDIGGDGMLDVVYGCEAQAYYYDGDGDGFGRDEPPTMRCAGDPPPYYSALPTDCDDFRVDSYPEAVELCNGRDDDCDSQIDEGAIPIEIWPDKDGDGYYREGSGPSIKGCIPTPGYAAERGDCDETNPAVHRGAAEMCNQLDDDCDGRADEGARPQCGVGWCRRESPTCSAQDCVEGAPAPESCNGLDDDCNGEVDDGSDCGSDASCVEGQCRSESAATAAPEAGETGGPEGSRGPGEKPASAAPQSCGVTGSAMRRESLPIQGYGLALAALVFIRRRRMR